MLSLLVLRSNICVGWCVFILNELKPAALHMQIAIFVLPVMVLVGWAIGRPFLLDFEPFAALVLTLSVIHTYFVSADGNSNWCECGLLLHSLVSSWHAGLQEASDVCCLRCPG